ncbi:hypothetical protein ACFPER_09970 [Agromyces aurantiacus]|uniref:Signal transduction histidine kinase subgroup 3 dimerisation and phosphoacceptor domain-containing protein n=1 Tax=Agromyces aurantiacus TaxID=165814 RepID=A0ABV9R6N2_9MICO|nr:hypothetical protein [Agromyces aurantiacus]MBM7503801.1 signal transduction histidine kinase [Agromyces aurantiacus]
MTSPTPAVDDEPREAPSARPAGRMAGTRARPATRWGGALVVALAWAPATAAAAVLSAGDPDWARPLRVIVTALVWAPVAVMAWASGWRAVAVILGALAVNSGWLALLVALRGTAAVDAEPLADALHAVLVWPRVPEVAALAVLPWLLVRRRSRGRRAGLLAGIATVLLDAGFATAVAVSGRPLGPLVLVTLVASIVLFAAGAVALAVEWHRDTGPRRAALSWLGLGGALLTLSYLPIAIAMPAAVTALGHAAFVFASGILPTAILAIVLGDRPDHASRRRFAGVVRVQGVVVAVALFLVAFETAALAGADRTVAGAFAAGTLALAFAPVDRMLRRRTDALVGAADVDARSLLNRLGEHLTEAPDPAAGLGTLAEALRATWSLDSVAIRPTSGGAGATAGHRGEVGVTVALHAGGREVGHVEATGPDGAALRRSVAPALEEISGLIAVAVLLADRNDEVAETRRRVLGVRQEERRLLHRELADELAPAIAGLGYGIAAARRLVRTAPPAAADAVAVLRVDVAARAEDVRRLARTLLPTALDEGDLDGALRELAQRTGGDERVRVRSTGGDVLEARIQLAVYLLAAEAVLAHRRPHELGRIELDVGIGEHEVRLGVRLTGGDPADAERLRLLVERRATELGATVHAADSGTGDGAGARVEVVMAR